MDEIIDMVMMAFFTGFMVLLGGLTFLAIGEASRLSKSGMFLVGIAILCLISIEADMFIATNSASHVLAPLKEKFGQVALSEPEHRYASDERGSTLDYGGSLDSILRMRRDMIEGMSMKGIFVQWHTDGGGYTCSGLFVHKRICLALLAVWGLITFLFSLCREGRWSRS